MLLRAVCATKTRRLLGSKAPWSNKVPVESGMSMTPTALSGIAILLGLWPEHDVTLIAFRHSQSLAASTPPRSAVELAQAVLRTPAPTCAPPRSHAPWRGSGRTG